MPEKQKLWFGVPPNGASERSFREAFRGERRARLLANHCSSLMHAIDSRPDQAPGGATMWHSQRANANHIGHVNHDSSTTSYLPYTPFVSLVHINLSSHEPQTPHRRMQSPNAPVQPSSSNGSLPSNGQTYYRPGSLPTSNDPRGKTRLTAPQNVSPCSAQSVSGPTTYAQSLLTDNFRFMRANRGHAESLSHPEKPQHAVSVTNVE